MNTLFVTFEFKCRVSGMSGSFKSEKIYNVNSALEENRQSEIERLVDDALRIAKAYTTYSINFECFDGFSSIDLLRINSDMETCDRLSVVTWTRNQRGVVMETDVSDPVKVCKRSVKKAVAHAVKLFCDQDKA